MKRALVTTMIVASVAMVQASDDILDSAAPAPVEVAMQAIESGDAMKAEQQLESIKNPAAARYVKACVLRAKGDLKAASKEVAMLVVAYPWDKEWMPKADYLAAELYLEQGLLRAAGKTADQVQMFYAGTEFEGKAKALAVKIEEEKKKKAESLNLTRNK